MIQTVFFQKKDVVLVEDVGKQRCLGATYKLF
jgi:hypothetical protein